MKKKQDNKNKTRKKQTEEKKPEEKKETKQTKEEIIKETTDRIQTALEKCFGLCLGKDKK